MKTKILLKSLRDLFLFYLGLYLCVVFIFFDFYGIIHKTFFTIEGRSIFLCLTLFFWGCFFAKYDMKYNKENQVKETEQ